MPDQRARRGWGRWCGAAAALVLVGAALSVVTWWAGSPDRWLEESRLALEARDYERAASLAARVLHRRESTAARLIAGEAATRLGRFEEAAEYYRPIPDDGSDDSVTALYCRGDLLLQLGHASEAEAHYRRVLDRRPGDLWARQQLASVLGMFGRRWESLPHLLELVRSEGGVEPLLFLGNAHGAVALPDRVEEFRRQAPDDPAPLIALSQAALQGDRHEDAIALARAAIDKDPRQIEAWAVLGRALVEGADHELASWNQRLPATAEDHPDVWLVRGLWMRREEEWESAARCFWEAVRRAPDLRGANYHLGQVLLALGREEDAAFFLERVGRLEDLESVLTLIYRSRGSVPHMRQAAELTESFGRFWEAAGWCGAALELQPHLAWPRDHLRRLRARLAPDLPQTHPEFHPALRVDLSEFPLPRSPSSAPADGGRTADAAPSGTVRFIDSAASAGIDVRYFNGSDPPEDGKLIFQTLGGGAGVLDYDGDGWPDLYFAQGAASWPESEGSGLYRDRLFRNLGDGRFADVTDPTGLGDARFTHGVAAGDYNDDGFPDLYVANAGANRLYRNNGDGTFTDVSEEAGLPLVDRRCTSSALLADLNGDGLPDIYEVNYLSREQVYSLICYRDGLPRSCDPRLFDAEPDRLFLNLGDGRFEEITEAAGVGLPNGKGLGIVAADFTGSGRLDLFVANDGVANFFLINETAERGGRPRFREAGFLSGLAFDRDGRAQACMGVAVDDADGSGRLDLFVTNFYEESNTLYRNSGAGLFEDATRTALLREPGMLQLGFGTQFLDADLDGFPDLVVANGHIEDHTDRGKPYRMPPQFFRNLGGGQFAEPAPEALGPYFEGRYLGRGLARLDWNRDGREDLVVTHLDAPAALLTNDTPEPGHGILLRFRGTTSGRDAIGVTAHVTAGGRTRARQLTAGDGYLVSNERQLIFGLGAADRVERLAVRWPSGREQVFTDLAAGQELLLIESRPAPIPLGAFHKHGL